MLTPAFDLSQDPDFLTIVIKVPYARVSEFDIYCEGDDFKFYAKPYFLRLTLPGRIVEDGREKASYDVDEATFTVKFPKETPGKHFEGLGMLTALLAPKGSRSAKPLVEELDAPAEMEDDNDDFDWQVEQTPFEEDVATLNSKCSYGFGSLRSGVFSRLQNELSDVIDLRNPDSTPADKRYLAQLAAEEAKFDPDHYLADLFEDESIQPMLHYRPWWADAYCKKATQDDESSPREALVSFSDEEKQQLRNFKNKSFLLDKSARRQAYLSLIDILLAYCYDVRVTEGEKNVESSWNIRKLSGTLSWLQTYSSVHGLVVSFGRRVLCYPLYRHVELAMNAVKDVSLLLQMGKAAVLKCLLHIHRVFQENDPAYILNDLYITDYCIWIQQARSKKLAALAECLKTTNLTKTELGFELEELELAARLVQDEEAAVTSITDSKNPQAAVEASDVEDSSSSSENTESDSSSSSDTEDSDSDFSSETEETESSEEDLSHSKDVKIPGSQDALREKRAAPLVEDLGPIQDTEGPAEESGIVNSDWSLHSVPVTGGLVEEIGGQLQAEAAITKQSGDLVNGVNGGLQDAGKPCAQPAQETDVEKADRYLQPSPVSGDLVEELGEHLQTAVVLFEQSEDLITEVDGDLQEANTGYAQPAPDTDVEKKGHSFQSSPISVDLVEELGEQLQTAVLLSEQPEDHVRGVDAGFRD